MPGKGVEIGGISAVQGRLFRFTEASRRAIREEVAEAGVNIQAEAQKLAPIDQARLRSSIRPRERDGGMSTEVFSDANYAVYVHEGTRAHTPPFSAILKWARRKLKGNKVRARAMAGAVWQHIRQHGTKPHPFLTPALEREAPSFVRRLGARLGIELRRSGV